MQQFNATQPVNAFITHGVGHGQNTTDHTDGVIRRQPCVAHRIRAAAADQIIVRGAAKQQIVTEPTIQHIGFSATGEAIIARPAADPVAAGTP